MKKAVLTIMGIVLLTLHSPHNTSAQSVEQGTIIIDPYYGFPFAGKILIEELFSPMTMTVTGVGPTGGRIEYLLTDRFGMGIDIIYKQIIGDFTAQDTASNNIYTYRGTVTRTRIQVRFNYHLMASGENLDLYVGMATGTNNRKVVLTSVDDPTQELTFNNFQFLPFSARIAFGMRYYFMKNIGLNTELGIGGPLITAGVSIKF